jgi:hypothetical protein
MSDTIIRDSLVEAIDAAVAGNHKFFITLEARQNPDLWVQLRWDYVNAAYPHATDPRDLLQSSGISLPPNMTLEAWEPNRFVTFEHGADPVEPVVEFVTAYFEHILELIPSGFTLDIARES